LPFDGQRDAFEPLTQPSDRPAGSPVDDESGQDGHGAVREQCRGVVLEQRLWRVREAGLRHRQGRDGERGLPEDALQLAARGQDAQQGTGPQQRVGQLCARIDEVLAVVEYERQVLVGQVLGQRGDRPPRRLVTQAEPLRDRMREQRRVLELGQFDEVHPVGKRPPRVGCDPQRQARLAHTADAGQRDQAGHAQ